MELLPTDKPGARWPGDTRPPFLPGNTEHLTHGIRARLGGPFLSPKAAAFREELIDRYEWISEADEMALEIFCNTFVMARHIHEAIDAIIEGRTTGPKGGTGVTAVSPWMFTEARGADRQALEALTALALTPTSRATLFKDLGWAHHLTGQGVKEVAARGKALREKSA